MFQRDRGQRRWSGSRLFTGILLILGLLGLGWTLNAIFGWAETPDDTLGRIADIAGVMSLLVAILAALWPIIDAASRARSSSLAQLADDLAGQVQAQWLTAESAHALRQSGILPISWSAATGMPDEKGRIHVDKGRLKGDFEDAAAKLARTYAAIPDGRLLILGEPGSGKTVLAILLTLGILDQRSSGDPVPVLLPLSSWDPSEEALDDWMLARIADSNYGGRRDVPGKLLAADRILPVLDGLDEIAESARRIAVSGINRARSSRRSVVLTCRQSEFLDVVDGGGPVLREAALVQISPLAPNDVIAYLSPETADLAAAWQPVFTEIKDTSAGPLASAFRSPLMVSVARAAYEDGNADPRELLNFDGRHDLENHLLDRLVDAAYRSVDTPPHGRSRRSSIDRRQRWLTYLASHLNKHQEREFAWWLFASKVVSSGAAVPAALVAWLVNAALAFVAYSRIGSPKIDASDVPIYTLATGTILAFITISTLSSEGRPPGRLSFNVKGCGNRVRTAFLDGVSSFLTVAMVLAAAYPVFVLATTGGWSFEDVEAYCVAVVVLLGAGTTVGLGNAVHSWLTTPRDDARQADPVALVRDDRRSTAVACTVSAVLFALLLMPALTGSVRLGRALGGMITGWPGQSGHRGVREAVFSREYDTVADTTPDDVPFLALQVPFGQPALTSLFTGLLFFTVVFTSRAWPRFVIARGVLKLWRKLPLRLMTFLEDAHRRQLLRRAGGVYEFRHVRLQERLVTRAAPLNAMTPQPTKSSVRILAALRKFTFHAVAGLSAIIVVVSAVASAPKDAAAYVFDAGDNAVYRVDAINDGLTIVGRGSTDLRFWRLDDAEPFAVFPSGRGNADSDVSRDHRTVITQVNAEVLVWHVGTRQRIATIPSGDNTASILLSPDGATAFTAFAAGSLSGGAVWDARNGSLLADLAASSSEIAAEFSADSTALAAYSDADSRVLLLDVARNGRRAYLTMGSESVDDIAFSPTDSILAAVSDDRFRVWETNRRRLILDIDNSGLNLESPDFTPDGHYLTVSDGDGVRVFDARSGDFVSYVSGLSFVSCFGRDSRTAVATHSWTSRMALIDLSTGRPVAAIDERRTSECAFSPDGHFMATWHKAEIDVWETATGQHVAKFQGHTDDVNDVLFMPGSRRLISGSDDRTVRIWALPGA
jgi:WD40 repeat protein